ncbi:MtnX-like HAD-IB family phosphatase [Macrococcoides bohemicum]|uniref:MtnX-like HAD-IB family phosphatase n=1 Tax=Macrococcoides bohemicum TaxID=1903056 RepID=A0AAJ4PB12_9STAP|nr:MtnX-like HAD-IB family phosphatase [Macrococcus bohemicus]QYA42241.1 MtnX-like HAD-IB family phosphatase [Macrococcus bohemicus]
MGYIIACDFDGTVTATDTIIAIIKKFAPIEGQPITDQILNQEISIQQGVSELFKLLPSEKKEDIIQFVLEEVNLRTGFQKLLDEAQTLNIPFYIISGGMHFFIDPILEKFNGIKQVFANTVDFAGDYMEVIWNHPCDNLCTGDCGTCKPSIVRQLVKDDEVIAIGDSVTDLKLLSIADIAFTTSKLTIFAREKGIAHHHFETFDDIKLSEVIK